MEADRLFIEHKKITDEYLFLESVITPRLVDRYQLSPVGAWLPKLVEVLSPFDRTSRVDDHLLSLSSVLPDERFDPAAGRYMINSVNPAIGKIFGPDLSDFGQHLYDMMKHYQLVIPYPCPQRQDDELWLEAIRQILGNYPRQFMNELIYQTSYLAECNLDTCCDLLTPGWYERFRLLPRQNEFIVGYFNQIVRNALLHLAVALAPNRFDMIDQVICDRLFYPKLLQTGSNNGYPEMIPLHIALVLWKKLRLLNRMTWKPCDDY